MGRVAWLSLALLASNLGACERHNHASSTAGSTSSARLDAAVEAAVDVRADAGSHARAPTPKERNQYRDAVARGRAATVAKNYPDAIAAFGEALAATPSDARALSERGYARFLSGDNAGSEKDFNSAIDAVPKSDRKLTAQIYYNLGLAAEKRSDAGAGAYFRSSYEYNPTPAAKSKMSSCPVAVGGPFTIDSVAKLTAYEEVDNGPGDVNRLLKDAGNKAFVGATDDDESAHALLPKSSGGYFRFDTNAKLMQSRTSVCCFTRDVQDEVDIVRSGSLWIVTTQPMVASAPTQCPCGDCKAGTMVDDYRNGGKMKCEASPFPTDTGFCIPCGGTIDQGVGVGPDLTPGGSREVFYVDAATGAALWDVSYDTAFEKTVKLTIEAGALHVTGQGCDIVAPRP